METFQEKADAQATAAGSAPQATGVLMDIGEVASRNIRLDLANRGIVLEEDAVPVIKNAIRDEINAMSSHFTLAMADVATQHEIAEKKAQDDYEAFVTAAKAREKLYIDSFRAKVAEIKSTFNFIHDRPLAFAALGFVCGTVGLIIGLLV